MALSESIDMLKTKTDAVIELLLNDKEKIMDLVGTVRPIPSESQKAIDLHKQAIDFLKLARNKIISAEGLTNNLSSENIEKIKTHIYNAQILYHNARKKLFTESDERSSKGSLPRDISNKEGKVFLYAFSQCRNLELMAKKVIIKLVFESAKVA